MTGAEWRTGELMTESGEELPVEEIRRQLATMKAEVDALQISLGAQRRSQWLQSSTVIAVIAVLVTLATWWNDAQRRESVEQQAARVELAELTQRLSERREANAELWKNYSSDPNFQELASAALIESLVMADQASKLIDRLDSGFTGWEHYTVADVYQLGGFLAQAHQAATDGLTVADTDLGRISLLRKLAIIEATMDENPSSIEERLTEALEVGRRADDDTAAWTAYETERIWALLLASLHECPAALEHAQKAKDYIDEVPRPFISDSAAYKRGIDDAVRSCLPPAQDLPTAGG